MTSSEYKNTIQWTLATQTPANEDILTTARRIFQNLGVAFPQGTLNEVLNVFDSGDYMGWNECNAEQARYCANNGYAAIGITHDRIVIILPDSDKVTVKSAVPDVTHPVASELSDIGEKEVSEMQFFAYAALIEKQESVQANSRVMMAAAANMTCYECESCQSCDSCESGCEWSCQSSCQSACQTCDSCQSTCETICQSGCEVTCQEGCQVACQSACQVACQSTCQVGCQTCDSCQSTCQIACQTCDSCQSTCETICQSGCEVTCQEGCQVACQSTCQVACQSTCQVGCQTCDSCQSTCQVVCQTCDSCQSVCETVCQNTCEVTYQNNCQICDSCDSACETICQENCEVTCQESDQVSVILIEPEADRTEMLTDDLTIFIDAVGTNCSRIAAYVNGSLVRMEEGNSLSCLYSVNSAGAYAIYVVGTGNTGITVHSNTNVVTVVDAEISEGYYRIKNSNGKYLTYSSPVRSDDSVTVNVNNNSDTQIWKIEGAPEENKYHIKPAHSIILAMNIFRSGSYPCTIYTTSNNETDTSFSIDYVTNTSYVIRYKNGSETYYLLDNGTETYWAQTESPQIWTFEPVSYTLSSMENAMSYPVEGITHSGITYPGHRDNSRDLAAAAGTAIYATMAGTVTDVVMSFSNNYNYNPQTEVATGGATADIDGKMESYGNYIKIQVDMDDSVLMYAHQQKSDYVQKGDKVFAGQQIGKVGNTGCSTGNHLHFEVCPVETSGNTVFNYFVWK